MAYLKDTTAVDIESSGYKAGLLWSRDSASWLDLHNLSQCRNITANAFDFVQAINPDRVATRAECNEFWQEAGWPRQYGWSYHNGALWLRGFIRACYTFYLREVWSIHRGPSPIRNYEHTEAA